MKKNNIVLIGFMGVGKGKLARKLAAFTGQFAIDTDDLIESLENKTTKRIFEKYGEPHFRKLETKCALWCQNNINNTIISTGGGFYTQQNICSIGKIVYLKADFHYILNELKKDKNYKQKLEKRPLFVDEKKAQKLYDDRALAYEMVADIVVDIRHTTYKQVIAEIIKATK